MWAALATGAGVGLLGGLIGLGGAEFRLPLLIALFGFAALQAVIMNNAIGASIGASWATRVRSATLCRVLAVLLGLIAVALPWNHFGNLNPLELHHSRVPCWGWRAASELASWPP